MLSGGPGEHNPRAQELKIDVRVSQGAEVGNTAAAKKPLVSCSDIKINTSYDDIRGEK